MRPSSPSESTNHGLEWLLVTLLFLLFASQIPPEVNEPNYLAKARHYWNPAWCADDFFLNSADAHAPFYLGFGWLLLYLPMETVAWIGRMFTCGLLAFGWVKLTSSLTRQAGVAVIAAAIAIGLNTFFQYAGEWITGGFEGKGIAYGIIFWALAEITQNRWNRAWILLGIASIFHVLVGGWACVAATIGWFILGKKSDRPTLQSQLWAIALGFIISLIGVLPGLQLSGQSSFEETTEAAQVQVFTRLPHHLNPDQFFFASSFPYITPAAIRFAVLVAFWAILARRQKAILPLRRLDSFTAGAIGIAALGLCLSLATRDHPALAARLLQYYWFRLADVIVPVSCGLSLAYHLSREQVLRRLPLRFAILAGTVCILMVPLYKMYHAGGIPPADRKFTSSHKEYNDWLSVCAAAKNISPPNALFVTPKYAHTFKWYADRGEVGTWKEMPQDAESILEWHTRLKEIHIWGPYGAVPLAERSAADLRVLSAKYGADFLLTRSHPALALPLLYRNDSFALYRMF